MNVSYFVFVTYLCSGAPARIPEFIIARDAPKMVNKTDLPPKAHKALQFQNYSKILLLQSIKVSYSSSALF